MIEEGCTCHKCGEKYKVDILVSDELWKKIRPDKARPVESGLMCGVCIFKSIEALNKFDSFSLTYS